MIIKIILFFVFFSVFTFFAGNLILDTVGFNRTVYNAFVWGLLLLFAICELIAYPLYRLSLSFTLFLTFFAIVLFFIGFISLLYFCKNHHAIQYGFEIKAIVCSCKTSRFLSVVLLLSIISFLFYSLAFYYPTTDDGYYMPRSMEVIKQNNLAVNVRQCWLGWSDGELPDFTDASSLVFFIAFFSRIFSLNPTVLAKTGLALFLLLVHIFVVLSLSDTIIFKRKHVFQKKALIIILYLAFSVLSVKADSAGTWMTGYIWNGKALLPALIFPMLIAASYQLMNKVDTLPAKNWLSILIILLAGMCVSIVGLNLPIILFSSLGLSFLIITKCKYLKKIWKPTLLVILPVLIVAILSYLFVIRGLTDYYNIETVYNVQWKNEFLNAIDFFQFVLYIGAVVFILCKGSFLQKALFAIAPALLLLTFLNPLLTKFVSTYVTSALVYFRLWWLLPVYFLPSYALSELTDYLTDGKIQNGLICGLLSLGILAGYEVFRDSIIAVDYTIIPFAKNVGHLIKCRPELRTNLYGINAGTYETAKAIITDTENNDCPRVLMYFNRPFELRQYSDRIIMVCGIRDIQLTEDLIPGTDLSIRQFMQSYNLMKDGQKLHEILDILDVDYICFDTSPAFEHPDAFGFEHICTYGNIDTWKVK